MNSPEINTTYVYIEKSWIEQKAIGAFRIWHVMFLSFSAVLFLAIFLCCCIKIRIPRTKQEIEADYQRKKIARKFRQQLKMINNQEMDAMDLKRALERIQEDFKSEIGSDTDAGISISTNSVPADVNISCPSSPLPNKMKAEPQQPTSLSLSQKIATLVKMTKTHQTLNKDETLK